MSSSCLFVCESSGIYRAATSKEIIIVACEALARDFDSLDVMSQPSRVKEYLSLKISDREYEIFGVMFLDSHNRLIAYEELFRGSLSQTMVYPREVAKTALQHNCDGVILFHNHPGGTVNPSHTDMKLTRVLREALSLIDVFVRDHVICAAGGKTLSMAEEGLL